MTFLSEENQRSKEFYAEHYHVVACYPLVAEKPFLLSDHSPPNEQMCRFCKKSVGDTTFKKKAHAVPESLGCKSIISLNECDRCNVFFGKEYEDHLAKRLGPGRTMSGLRGKQGVPTYKTDYIRAENRGQGLNIRLFTGESENLLREEGAQTFEMPVPTPTQPYVPIRSAKALVKAACSLVPKELLTECEGAIDWLMNPEAVGFDKFPVLFAFTPGVQPYGNGHALVVQRKSELKAPFLWLVVATTNFRFQVMVPFCKSDRWLAEGQIKFPGCHFPIPFDVSYEERFGPTQFDVENWASIDLRTDSPKIAFHVENARRSR